MPANTEMQRKYPLASEWLDTYVSDDQARAALHAEVERMLNDLPKLTKDEQRFADACAEVPLIGAAEAATVAGFSASMGETLANDPRIKAHFALHIASVRLMKLLRGVADLRKGKEHA